MPTLLGEWGFLDNLLDTSGNNRHGTVTGSPTYVTGPQTNTRGLKFSTDTDSVSFGRTGLEPSLEGITVMGWVRMQGTPSVAGSPYLFLLSKARATTSSRSRMGFTYTTSGNLRQRAGVARWKDALLVSDAGPSWTDDAWHHLAIVDGNTRYGFYLDGVQDANASRALGATANTTWEDFPWRTGFNTDLNTDMGAHPNMSVSGIRIFQGELTTTEIQTFRDTPIVSQAPVAFDAVGPSGTYVSSGTPFTWTHTPVGSPKAIIVALAGRTNAALTAPVRTVSYGGVPMTSLGIITANNFALTVAGTSFIELFGLLNPPTGPQTVSATVTFGGSFAARANSLSYTGVGSFGTPVTGFGTETGTAMSQTIASAVGDMVVAGFCQGSGGVAPTAYSHTSRFSGNASSNGFVFGDAVGAAPSVTVTAARTSSNDYGMIGVDLVAATVAGGTPVAAAFSGGGSLTATTTPQAALTASLSAVGTLGATVVPSMTAAAALTGDGTLSATATRLHPMSVNLSGDGTLTATVTPQSTTAVTLTGSGALIGSVTELITQVSPLSPVLSGAGALNATAVKKTVTTDVVGWPPNIVGAYVGTIPAQKVYLGDLLLWP